MKAHPIHVFYVHNFLSRHTSALPQLDLHIKASQNTKLQILFIP